MGSRMFLGMLLVFHEVLSSTFSQPRTSPVSLTPSGRQASVETRARFWPGALALATLTGVPLT